jgi:GntR family transcriptional repressor for pyruvate dehydrogenase complex
MSDQRTIARIDRMPLISTVMERVQQVIDSEGLGPGDRIPSERQLQEGFGVGRSTVREALRALEALGIIEIRQGQGGFVRQRRDLTDPGSKADDKLSEDWSQLGAVIEARLVIETEAARLAALRRTPAQLDLMAAHLDAFESAKLTSDLPALVIADVEFHGSIAEAANPVLAHCLRSLGVLAVKSRQLSLRRSERHANVHSRHTTIFDAIAAGDSVRAAEAMSSHLSDFTTELGLKIGDMPRGPAIYLLENGGSDPGELIGARLDDVEASQRRHKGS